MAIDPLQKIVMSDSCCQRDIDVQALEARQRRALQIVLGINIATFHVGREAPGGNAVALIEVDGEVPPAVLKKVQALPQVQSAKPLRF